VEIFIVIGLIIAAFALGRLTDFKTDNKIQKVQRELDEMTASRDRWRQQYLVRVMRDKLNELNCKNSEAS
jgi:uncharacterized membrane-anchored protein YhcB (DUF1043 family)